MVWICQNIIPRCTHCRLLHMLHQSMVAVGFPAALTASKLPLTPIPKHLHKCCSSVCTLPVAVFTRVVPCHLIRQPISCCRLPLVMSFCRPVLQHECMWSLIRRYPCPFLFLVALHFFITQAGAVAAPLGLNVFPCSLTDTWQHVAEWRFVDCTESQCNFGCSWSSSQRSIQCLSGRSYSFLKHVELCVYGRGTLDHVLLNKERVMVAK